jgi:pimeloyl-ACP methyl ester carboxylesterase
VVGALASSITMAQVTARSTPAGVIRVASKDGTEVAVECAGSGPTLLLVHGGVGDRTRWTPMLPLLSTRFAACAMDRRGHGESGDADAGHYSLLKEAEDVAAVVESRPGQVFVLGHSYGGVAALEATLLTGRIDKLVLYEPPVQEPVDLGVIDRIERLIAEEKREDAAVTFWREVALFPASEIEAMRSRPSWNRLVASIDEHPRQMRALAAYRFEPARMKSMTVPTLLLLGEKTASPHIRKAIDSLRATLPVSELVVLRGQQHNAMDSDRPQLAEAVAQFLLGPSK